MSSINSSSEITTFSSRKRAGVPRMQKHTTKVDMTPMVDLGFLLITFFVITTELNKPTVMNLNMPADGAPMPLGESNAISFLLGKNNTVYYYSGKWDDAIKNNQISPINYAGINSVRTIITDKQRRLDATINKNKEGRDGLMLLIKPGNESSYANMVDILDEATINVVKKYMVVKPSAEETIFIKTKEK